MLRREKFTKSAQKEDEIMEETCLTQRKVKELQNERGYCLEYGRHRGLTHVRGQHNRHMQLLHLLVFNTISEQIADIKGYTEK